MSAKSRDCPICFESYKKPRFLPCHHSMCEACLLDLVKSKEIQPGGRINCPECRQQHVWTKNWEQRFPRNFYLETEDGVEEVHKESMTQEQTCQNHKKRITMFCDEKECQVYICHSCFVSDHKDHVIQDAEDVIKREHFRGKLRENVKQLEKILKYVCEVEKAQNMEDLETAEKVTIEKLNKQVKLVVEKIEEAGKDYERLIKQNTAREKRRVDMITERHKDLEAHMKTVQEATEQNSEIVSEDRVKELLTRSTLLCNIGNVDLRRKPKCVELDCPNLEKAQSLNKVVENALGSLETVNEEVSVAAPLLLPESSSIQVAHIVTWNTGCEAEHPMRVCMSEYDTILICEIVPRLVGSDTVVKTFTLTGDLQSDVILPVRGVKSWPSALVDIDGVNTAIAYNDMNGIEKQDVSKKPFSIVELIKSYLLEPPPTKYFFKPKRYIPKRMCYGPPGCVLLVDETCTVHVINTTVFPWRHVRSMKVESHYNAGVSGLGCVTIPSGHLVLVTFFPYYTVGGSIKALDFATGDEIWTMSAIIDNELCCPWSVCADEENHIFIADGWNRRVLVINTSGEYLQTLQGLVPEMLDVLWVGWSETSRKLFVFHKTQEEKGIAAMTSCDIETS